MGEVVTYPWGLMLLMSNRFPAMLTRAPNCDIEDDLATGPRDEP